MFVKYSFYIFIEKGLEENITVFIPESRMVTVFTIFVLRVPLFL